MIILAGTALEERALAVARQAHRGQVDKQGRDYLQHHLLPIAALLRPFGSNAYSAGLLHDILEDTPVTVADLDGHGIPGPVTKAVLAVTRRAEESYPELIDRAAADPLGRLVKLADNWLNLSGLDGLAESDPVTAERLRRRYESARTVLEPALLRP